jgi:hypothetical protein
VTGFNGQTTHFLGMKEENHGKRAIEVVRMLPQQTITTGCKLQPFSARSERRVTNITFIVF